MFAACVLLFGMAIAPAWGQFALADALPATGPVSARADVGGVDSDGVSDGVADGDDSAASDDTPPRGANYVRAAGNDRHLWIVVGDVRNRFQLLHRMTTDSPLQLRRATRSEINGRIASGGLIVEGDRLWLAYETGEIQSIAVEESRKPPLSRYGALTMEKPLPEGARLISLAATDAGLWVLVRYDEPRSVASTEHAAGDPRRRSLSRPGIRGPGIRPTRVLPMSQDSQDEVSPGEGRDAAGDMTESDGLDGSDDLDESEADVTDDAAAEADDVAPPATAVTVVESGEIDSDADGDTDADADADGDADADADAIALIEPGYALLALRRGQWTEIELPVEFNASSPAYLVTMRTDRDPVLLSLASPRVLVQATRELDSWAIRQFELPAGLHESEDTVDAEVGVDVWPVIRPLVVEGQLVVARAYRHNDSDSDADAAADSNSDADTDTDTDSANAVASGAAVEFFVLRPEAVSPLGELSLSVGEPMDWAAAAFGDHIGLIEREGDGVRVKAKSLQGKDDSTSGAFDLTDGPRQDPNSLLVVTILAASMLMVLLVWRRDPMGARLQLPSNMALADFGRRAIAAAIDLAPGLVFVLVFFNQSLQDAMEFWPAPQAEADAVLYGALIAAIFIVHTTVTEVFTGRSLGKLLLSLAVVNMDGRRPAKWRLLVRGLMRLFDVIAWYVLPLLIVLSPFRQRLGDMLVQTVVVSVRKTKGEPNGGDEADAEGDGDDDDDGSHEAAGDDRDEPRP